MLKRTLLALLVLAAGCAGAGELGDLDAEDVGVETSELISSRTCSYTRLPCTTTTCHYSCTTQYCEETGQICWKVVEDGCYRCWPSDPIGPL